MTVIRYAFPERSRATRCGLSPDRVQPQRPQRDVLVERVLGVEDGQHEPASLPTLIEDLDRGYDVVIGSRGMGREGFSLVRKLGSQVFRTLRAAFLLKEIKDTQCGFKLFDRRRTLPLFERMVVDRFAFDVELLYLSHRFGLRQPGQLLEPQQLDLQRLLREPVSGPPDRSRGGGPRRCRRPGLPRGLSVRPRI